MFIVIQDDTVGNDLFNFKNTTTNSDQLSTMELTFNGETRLSKDIASAMYLRFVQPLACHTKTPSRYLYNYSFALRPEEAFPTGQVNMSRIITKLLTVTTTVSTVPREIRVYAINYNVLRVRDGLAGLIFNSTTYG